MSLESVIADCHRRGFRVGDLSELRAEPGVWRARLWTRDDQDTDFSTGRTAEIALKNALAEITAAPGSERARDIKNKVNPACRRPRDPKPGPTPKSGVPVPRSPAPPLPPDLDDFLSL